MFDTIVWASDGSEYADGALALVTELAMAHGSAIVALHVVERFRAGRVTGAPVLADEEERRSKIEAQVADLRAAGFDARLELVTSRRHNLAAAIAVAAAAADADLIVVASRGRGEAAAFFEGSVARDLTHEARCPVLVIPPAALSVPDAVTAAELGA